MSYSTSLGRFLERDPIGYSEDGMNLYEADRSNPTNFVDPMGLCSLSLTGGLPAGVTGTGGAALETVKVGYNWFTTWFSDGGGRIFTDPEDFFIRAIRASTSFQTDRASFISKIEGEVNKYLVEFAKKGESGHKDVPVADLKNLSLLAVTGWTGGVTAGRFYAKKSTTARLTVTAAEGKLKASVTSTITYEVNDQWDLLGSHDPKQFKQTAVWSETLTGTAECDCLIGGGAGGGKPQLPFDGENHPF